MSEDTSPKPCLIRVGDIEWSVANAVLKLVDSSEPLTSEKVLRALSEVPFVRHQYKWLVDELASLPPKNASTLLAGYCGARRLPPAREKRFAESVRLLAGLTPPERAALPSRIITPNTHGHSGHGILPLRSSSPRPSQNASSKPTPPHSPSL